MVPIPRRRLFYITIPLMSPVIFYNLVIGIIGTFQYFTEVYVITATADTGLGGPAESTLFYNVISTAMLFVILIWAMPPPGVGIFY